MNNALRTTAVALGVLISAPAAAQVLLLDVNTTVPLAAAMDNPCTPELEAIAFQGATELAQRVWLLPDGSFRLQVAERTAMQGVDTAASLLGTATKYALDAVGQRDLEFSPASLSLVMFKKVSHAAADNFHAALVMAFDPQRLQLQLGVEPACDNGQP